MVIAMVAEIDSSAISQLLTNYQESKLERLSCVQVTLVKLQVKSLDVLGFKLS